MEYLILWYVAAVLSASLVGWMIYEKFTRVMVNQKKYFISLLVFTLVSWGFANQAINVWNLQSEIATKCYQEGGCQEIKYEHLINYNKITDEFMVENFEEMRKDNK